MEYLFGESIESKEPKHFENIVVTSPDLNSLLVDWLSELLLYSTVQRAAVVAYNFDQLAGNTLKSPMGTRQAEVIEDIKAITLHDLRITHHSGMYRVLIVFDI